jgi:hypothetical protein
VRLRVLCDVSERLLATQETKRRTDMFANLGSMRKTLLQVHHIGSHSTAPLGGATRAEHAVLILSTIHWPRDDTVSYECQFTKLVRISDRISQTRACINAIEPSQDHNLTFPFAFRSTKFLDTKAQTSTPHQSSVLVHLIPPEPQPSSRTVMVKQTATIRSSSREPANYD